MIKTILCPIDGSTHADKAADLAADLAKKYGAKLLFFHVCTRDMAPEDLRAFAAREGLREVVEAEMERIKNVQVAAIGPGAAVYIEPISPEVLRQVGEAILERAKQRAKRHGVGEVATAMTMGNPAKCILERAESEPADMIVVGSRGLGHLKGIFLGSVSNSVSHHAGCTCISVK